MKPNNMFKNFISTCRYTPSVDEGGSPVETFSTYLSDIPCLVQPMSGLEPVLAGRKYNLPVYKIYLDVDSDIDNKDNIVYNGNNYSIIEKIIYPDTYTKIVVERND